MAEQFQRTLFGDGARSSDGYQVRFNSRTSIEYRDASGVVSVGAEGLANGNLALFPTDISARSGTPPINDQGFRTRVIARVRRVADFLGVRLE